MNSKKCPFCNSVQVIKKGIQQGNQRWKCKDCNKKFQANRKALPKEELFCSFVFHKQTFKELSESYHIKINTLQKIFDEHVLSEKIHKQREIYLVVDGTYFGTTGTLNAFCLVVFRDEENKEDVWWKFCDVETYEVYKEGKDYLISLGYVIKGVTADGLPLIRNVFKDTPFQMCLVHMERILVRGTTKFPILDAGKALLAIASTLHTTNKNELRTRIIKYKEIYWTFLNEKATSLTTGDIWFVHRELLRAFKSLYNLFQYLFTYEQDKRISKTSNSLEGHFHHINVRVSVHHGLSLQRKQKLITAILLNSSVTLDEKKE
jgi:ribosomal protein L37AE/L43A